jgi:tripartite-type tricarboxylate transporter receptor subunit TctC
MIAQYREGAGGTMAMLELKSIEPDGHTLVVCDPGGSVFGPIAQNLDFSADDVRQVARIAFTPWILTVSAESPYLTVQDLIAAAKETPGEIEATISDIASADHYAWLKFSQLAGLGPYGFRWVPQGGGAAKLRAMLAGESHIDMLLPSLIADHVKDGKMRPLAVASEQRLEALPDVPTFKEAGIDLVEGLVVALYAPKAVPEEAIATLREALEKLKNDPEFREIYSRQGQDIAGFETSRLNDDEWAKIWEVAPALLNSVVTE